MLQSQDAHEVTDALVLSVHLVRVAGVMGSGVHGCSFLMQALVEWDRTRSANATMISRMVYGRKCSVSFVALTVQVLLT